MRNIIATLILTLGFGLPVLAETVHVGVDGLVCAFCAKGIEDSFKKNDAVAAVEVNLDSKLVTLTTKGEATLDDATIKQTIEQNGFNVTNIHRQK